MNICFFILLPPIVLLLLTKNKSAAPPFFSKYFPTFYNEIKIKEHLQSGEYCSIKKNNGKKIHTSKK